VAKCYMLSYVLWTWLDHAVTTMYNYTAAWSCCQYRCGRNTLQREGLKIGDETNATEVRRRKALREPRSSQAHAVWLDTVRTGRAKVFYLFDTSVPPSINDGNPSTL
jgi:hypothetical protein